MTTPKNLDSLRTTLVNFGDERGVVELVEPSLIPKFSGHDAIESRGVEASQQLFGAVSPNG
jgi:hypothetical protein